MILPALKSLIVPAALVAVGFAAGAGCVRYAWQSERLDQARAQLQASDALMARVKELENEKDTALSERDVALARARSANADAHRLSERLRVAAKQSAGAVSAGACGACERHLAECRDLLAEGAGLLAEGGELVGRLDADRAAVRKLTQPRP